MGEATILVVEDDESVGLTLQHILEAEGYQVEQATRLAEALTKIEHTQFDVLLLVQMGGRLPGMEPGRLGCSNLFGEGTSRCVTETPRDCPD
jgi:DNA-binding response OmpR family regulator